MSDRSKARSKMVSTQIERRGVRDEHVLAAMRKVPREAFVTPEMAEFAYEDSPLPIGEGQTISQPYIVASMIEAAELKPGERALEIGAGSGYAAAVMAEIAGQVHAIERHEKLGHQAKRRLAELGYDNAEVHVADGSGGWPEGAPYDAILIAAGGPRVPDELKAQLAIGGRLVMPVGDQNVQSLTKVTRRGEDDYEEESLGAVRFVPLIGSRGWTEDGSRSASSHIPGASERKTLPQMVADAAETFPDLDDPGFASLFDRWSERRVVLLGEASHGTSEFYRARTAITKRLVEKHGFSIVAAEADWPDAAVIDRHIRRREPREDAEPPFQRFPTWMWRNEEFAALVDWMYEHNGGLDADRRAGFYGLDMYNMRGSIAAVLDYLDREDPEAAEIARERYGCLTPWQNDPATYGRAVLTDRYRDCEAEVVRQCQELLDKALAAARSDGEKSDDLLDAAQNARLVASAERYYRIMYYGGAESWNLRDTHMFETLEQLLEAKGPESKAVVWAHNSHIGDARHTDMGAVREELNLGQLCRERFGDQAALIGFGTHTGTVAAASDWGGEMEIKRVRPSRADSYERVCHDSGVSSFLLDMGSEASGAVRRRLMDPKLERFIGVIYRPETELMSHYSQAVLPRQFDAYVWFDETEAVTPLPGPKSGGVPETYPFGV